MFDKKDYLPTVMDYTKFLDKITIQLSISKEEARNKYGRYTYQQWYKLLK
jgi:hypothetical protein